MSDPLNCICDSTSKYGIDFLPGRETERVNRTDESETDEYLRIKIDAIFEVYCVLKNDHDDVPLHNYITIRQVAPRHGCSGTKVETGKDYFIALQR